MVAWLVVTPARASLERGAPVEGAAFADSVANVSSAIGYTAAFNASFAPAAPAPTERASEPVAADGKAPLCDRRGAITFASAPQMQDVEVSLDTSLTPEECLGNDARALGDRHRAGPDRAPLPNDANDANDASSRAATSAVLSAAVTLAAIARELTPAPEHSTPCSRPGFRSTVDRPPRV